ncbi:DUF2059 domain-containing protein [Xinfangfangia sp. CPCC 101601]|uniref:DUF2059 domain-containing protein n=1 Tax=Pseudogemmobacter lacusdianii TaxID=3069608 RepID=A0ABU0W3X0_9RHOB|nr:DUF2059 domain-containing protein [Xinfangfangia sp. CPCC 101601]MDQ2068155.1 DUF2059 domain-containing protein [Xinfangfangia sp. CPCC 101601]
MAEATADGGADGAALEVQSSDESSSSSLGGSAADESAEPSGAATPPPVAAERLVQLAQLLLLSDGLELMRDEGEDYGAALAEQMFPGRDGPSWQAQVRAIYDPVANMAIFQAAFAAALAEDPATVAAAEAFFDTARGQEILRLELEARRALMDVAVEEAAQVEAERMKTDRDPKLRLLRDLIEAGDLIEANVAAALSSNLAFYQGMAEGSGSSGADAERMLAEVWAQEGSIRAETAGWLVPYLALAYQPLSDEDLKSYIAFSRSDAGQRLNAALFAGYDAVARHVAFAMGRAAAEVLAGSDI